MTIRNRLTWLFLGLVALILLGALSLAFVLQARYAQREFHLRLRDRAQVTGYFFLEEDELHSTAFRNFKRRYLQTLPGEVLQVYDAQLQPRFIRADRRVQLPPQLLARIVSEKEVYFDIGKRQAVGIFYRDNQGEYIIVAAAENQAGKARLRHLAAVLALIFGCSLLATYGAGRFLAGRALAPIAAVNDQVDRITGRDLHLRVSEGLTQTEDEQHADEIARLARTFNRMLARLEESFEGQRTFVSNASHELRTPLTATIGELQVMLTRDREPAAYRESMNSVLHDLLQMKLLINNLLELAQTDTGAKGTEEIRLDELLWEVRDALPPAQRRRVNIVLTDLPSDPDQLVIGGNRQLLARALTNLLDNALKYSGEAPVTATLTYQPGQIRIRVADEGIGIDEKALSSVFQPFFRADNARGIVGHGVGLPLAHKILALHNGSLSLHSQLGEGTVAEVLFEESTPV